MPRDCVVDTNQCVDCPEIPSTPGRPGSVVVEPRLAWDSGANSVVARDGDWAVFSIQPSLDCGGVVIGTRSAREAQNDPTRVEHALYFRSVNGDAFVSVLEGGEQMNSPAARDADDIYEIRRISNTVLYLKNGRTIYTSLTPSLGTKVVTACMYASGDVVA